MNRRKFFGSIVVGALMAAGLRFREPKINPAWENATHEVHFIIDPRVYQVTTKQLEYLKQDKSFIDYVPGMMFKRNPTTSI